MARRLAAKCARNVILKEMRDIGLKGPARVVEEIRARRHRPPKRDREHNGGGTGAVKMLIKCGQSMSPGIPARDVLPKYWETADFQGLPAS